MCLPQLALDCVVPAERQVQRSQVDQSVDGRRPRTHPFGLLLRAAERLPQLGQLLRDARQRLLGADLRLGGGIACRHHLTPAAELVHAGRERLLSGGEPPLLLGDLVDLALQIH